MPRHPARPRRLALCLGLLLSPGCGHDGPLRLGTTFSHRALVQAGHDPAQALAACHDLGLGLLRMAVYWDEAESVEGVHDFRVVDDLLSQARAQGAEVLLSVGMKAPRWPEFYIPDWARPRTHAGRDAEVSRDPELRSRVLRHVEATVRHLAAETAIVAWQVENEPMDRSGPEGWFMGADLLAEEARTVRAADPLARPVVINCWSDDQRRSSAPWSDGDYALRNALDLADVLGLDVYPRAGPHGDPLGVRSILVPTAAIERARSLGKEAWIVESQAEPWPPAGCDEASVRWLLERHREQGYRRVLLWGFEWWYGQRQAGDPSLWEAVRRMAAGV
ncbi:MAG: beta-galactosidase [Planctomycetes bacterium]|nr:beta-galactosidase [Planctomycetota bacterium]